jgi:hypothetical protein
VFKLKGSINTLNQKASQLIQINLNHVKKPISVREASKYSYPCSKYHAVNMTQSFTNPLPYVPTQQRRVGPDTYLISQSSGICGGQSGTGTGFSPVSIIQPWAPHFQKFKKIVYSFINSFIPSLILIWGQTKGP